MVSNIRNVDLNLLVVLDALYDERSVTRTADRLSLSQPTVSGMLKRLRLIFDDDLYVRTSHGVVPTPRAEALAKPTRDIIASAQSLLVQEQFDPAEAAFTVNFCGSDYIQNTILGAFAGEILMLAPNARISLLTRPAGNLESHLSRGEYDFVVSTQDMLVPGLPALALYKDQLVCISSYAAHSDGQQVPLADLCALRHVILNPTGATLTRMIDGELRSRGFARNIVLDVPSFSAVFRAMQNAEFIAFMPLHLVQSFRGQFNFLDVDLNTPATEVFANWHPRMTNDARHIWLRETLQSTVKKFF